MFPRLGPFPFAPTVVAIPIGKLVVHPDDRSRVFGIDWDEVRLIDSVAELGIVTPLLVSLQNDGSCVVADGFRRYRAAVAIGLGSLPCQVPPKCCSIKCCRGPHSAKGYCLKH